MGGKMDKVTIIYGADHSVKLNDFKDMGPVATQIKKLYNNTPFNASTGLVKIKGLKKKYKDNPDVLGSAYVKVGLVKDDLVLRIKNEGKPKFEVDALLVKNLPGTQDLYGKKKAIKLQQKWFQASMSGSPYMREKWVKNILKALGDVEKMKADYRKNDSYRQLEPAEQSRKWTGNMSVLEALNNALGSAYSSIQKHERDLKMYLPNLKRLIADMEVAVAKKRHRFSVFKGLADNQDPNVVTLTDKEFDKGDWK